MCNGSMSIANRSIFKSHSLICEVCGADLFRFLSCPLLEPVFLCISVVYQPSGKAADQDLVGEFRISRDLANSLSSASMPCPPILAALYCC